MPRSGDHDAGNDCQQEQPQDVIHDRGADDHMRLARTVAIQVVEHPGRDADAGGAQGGSEEHVPGVARFGHQPPGHGKAESRGCEDADGRHLQTNSVLRSPIVFHTNPWL